MRANRVPKRLVSGLVGPYRTVTCGVAMSSVIASGALAAAPFVSTQDDFVALFPANPYVETREIDVGRDHASMRTYRVDEGRTQWLISSTDVGGLGLDLVRALAGARSGLIERSAGRITSEHAVRVGRYDGLEIRLELPDKTIVHARICVTGRRIYQALVSTSEEARRLSHIERFLQSFIPE